MAIIRKYTTEEQCIGLFMDEMFNYIDSTLITDNPEWRESWELVEDYDSDEDEEFVNWFDEDKNLIYFETEDTYDGTPAWQHWFEITDEWLRHKIEQLSEEVTRDCGFVLVYRDYELWGLAVHGAGYSFRDTHFKRLYELLDFHWHE